MAAADNALKLVAMDADDLQIISAQMQDAVLKVGDIAYLPRQQKVSIIAKRFDWEDAQMRNEPPYRRRLSALQFARVKSLKARKINQDSKDAVLMLLSIGFEARDAPAGDVVLTFAGGGDLSLEVECIEARLEDLGPEWETAAKPAHDMTGTG